MYLDDSRQVVAFKLPVDPQRLATAFVRLVEAIPENWRFMNGSVFAPPKLLARDPSIAHGVGYKINRFSTDPLMGAYAPAGRPNLSSDEAIRKAIEELVIIQSKPAYVRFNEAGWDPREFSLGFCKRIMRAYLERDYHVEFTVESSHDDNSYGSERESYNLTPSDWTCEIAGSKKSKPPAVLLCWQEKYRGKRENLKSLIETCEQLGLEPLDLS